MTVTVLLRAGLGNQMFQYAAGRRLALRRATALVLATAWYDTPYARAKRPFRLDRFGLIEHPSVRLAADPWDDITGRNEGHVFLETRMGFCPEVLDLSSNAVLSGYFGNARYFEDVADQIRADFQIPESGRVRAALDALRRPGRPLVSVHVRRGDYLRIRPDGRLVIGLDRISQAMASFGEADFLVFSDDMPWCRANLAADTVAFSPFADEVEDTTAMSMCDHHIIANSSFSWWGAWLNPSPAKRVLFPRNWHDGNWPGIGADPAEKEIALPGWIAY